MSLPALPPVARRATLLMAGAPLDADLAPVGEDELVLFLIERRLAAEVSAILPEGVLRPAARRALALERERVRVAADVQSGLIARCAAALSARGLDALLLKGEAVVRLTHRDASRRPMADLDLLARPGMAPAVVEALVAVGLERTPHDSPGQVVLVSRKRADDPRPRAVEVHEDVVAPPSPVATDVEGTFARAQPSERAALLVPDAADAAVLSALHLAFHEHDARKTLLTLRDVALLVRELERLGRLDALASRTRERGAAAIVAPLVERAEAWAGSPHGIAATLRGGAPLRRRIAASLVLREIDAGVASTLPGDARRWRVVGRRLASALWWERASDAARAVARLSRGRGIHASLRAAARQAAALANGGTGTSGKRS